MTVIDSYLNMKTMKCIKITVKGKVQGVGFRYFTKRNASDLGIMGYVSNKSYDQVEILACGRDETLASFVQIIKQGSTFSRVDDVLISEITQNRNYEDFKIKF